MAKKRCEIRVGTSGWYYSHWAGRFYPDGLAKDKWLAHYAQHFDTVEINNTFYHLPKAKTFENWHDKAPQGFVFTLKANRYITHIRRLAAAEEPVERFFAGAALLQEKLGPVLYQLPPNFQKDLELLADFMKLTRKRTQAFFEFRHKSWYSQDTYDLLDEYGFGFCVHDLGGVATPRVIAAEKIYLRLHGPGSACSGNYPQSALADWAAWIEAHAKKVTHVYAYFNNDINAYAVENAKTLRQLLGQE